MSQQLVRVLARIGASTPAHSVSRWLSQTLSDLHWLRLVWRLRRSGLRRPATRGFLPRRPADPWRNALSDLLEESQR